MASLFDLTGEALTLQRIIDSTAEGLFSEDPQEVAAATAELEALIAAEADNRKSVEQKADAWCWVIDQLLAQSTAQHAHAQRLKELATATEQKADVLKEQLVAALERINPEATSWTLPEHKLTSRRVTSVEISPDVAATDLPEQFQRARTTYSPDKSALKAALAAGQQIKGVELVERRSWSIK